MKSAWSTSAYWWKWSWAFHRWALKIYKKVQMISIHVRLNESVRSRSRDSIHWILEETETEQHFVPSNRQFHCDGWLYRDDQRGTFGDLSSVFANRSLKGFIKAKRYLASMGRYGNSPFLYPLYGSGEMTQCFCRLCGVFGGVYFLRFPLAGFTKDRSTEQCTGIVSTTGERFRAKDSVICNSSFLSALADNTQVLHRTVLITNRSIKSSEKEEVDKDRMDGQTLTWLL